MIYFLKVQFVHPLSFLILRFTCKSSLNSWRINDTLIYRYTSQCDQRSCMFWIRTKAHKTFTNTKMKSEACLKRMEGSDTFPTFCSRGARTEAFGIFVRDGSCVALHRRFVGNFMTAGNFGISNPKRETHSRCEPEILKKTRHENSAWKSYGAHALRFPTTKALAIFFHVNELKDTSDDEFPIKALGVWIILYKDFAMMSRWFQGLLLEVLIELQFFGAPNQLIFGYRCFLSCHHQHIQMFIVTLIVQPFLGGLPCLFSHSDASGIKWCLFRLLKFQVDAPSLHIAKLHQTNQEGRRGAEGPNKLVWWWWW